jgi:cytochrome c oxidase subunit 3
MPDAELVLAEQFDDLEQQEEASRVGMWVFLATEVLFFGGLFLAYIVYRQTYPHQFAIGIKHGELLLGTINTAILLTSSFTMALAVHAAQKGENEWVVRFLLCTILMGLTFLAVKGVEYSKHFSEHLFPGSLFRADLPHQVELFFWLYFVMTGLHALHVLIGIGLLSVIAVLAVRRKFSENYFNRVEVSGLYWHFVDIVWVFLYPLFYLIHK